MSLSRLFSRQKVLVPRPKMEDPITVRKEKDNADIAVVEAREEDRKANDPIGEPLNYGEYWRDQTPSQCFGMALINDYSDRVERIPKYRFKRAYFTSKVIIDTFFTDKQYEAADVEARREMAHKYGWKYAALGPSHHVLPQEGQRYPSQIEQLGL